LCDTRGLCSTELTATQNIKAKLGSRYRNGIRQAITHWPVPKNTEMLPPQLSPIVRICQKTRSSADGDDTQIVTLRLLRGDHQFARGTRVLLADHVANTGLSVRKTVDADSADRSSVVVATDRVHCGNLNVTGIAIPANAYLLEYDIRSCRPAFPLWKYGVPINTNYADGHNFRDAREVLIGTSGDKHQVSASKLPSHLPTAVVGKPAAFLSGPPSQSAAIIATAVSRSPLPTK